jgi:hypothetical protein
MKCVTASKRKRKNFDLHAKRRKEIVLHARFVGAMDTEDRGRWLVAWALHNPGARDQVWSLMQTARRMGGEITEAEAIAIADEAAEIPYCWKADRLAKYLGLTYRQRTILGITTIGACDFSKAQRGKQRRHKDRMAKWRKRRAAGMRPQSESLSATQPWKGLGISRRTWERHRNKARDVNDATLSTAYFLSSEDRPATPEGGAGLSERGFASKKVRERPKAAPPKAANKARGLPSSQTATTLAADVYATLPLELRLLALGLEISGAKIACAA